MRFLLHFEETATGDRGAGELLSAQAELEVMDRTPPKCWSQKTRVISYISNLRQLFSRVENSAFSGFT